jgi:putative transposase
MGTEMNQRRHSPAEISTKLNEAALLMQSGKSQAETAKALGISVMTFHRWRKAFPSRPNPSAGVGQREAATSSDVVRLESENARLRRLVADLLLEKVELQDALRKR